MYSRYDRPQKTSLLTWIIEFIGCVCCLVGLPIIAVLIAVAMGAK